MKWHLEENARFRLIFPDICWVNAKADSREQGFEWTAGAFTVDSRKIPRKEATVTAFSLESLPTGSHFDRIQCDDAVTEKNSDTANATRETLKKIDLLKPLLITPAYPIDYIGTIYSFGDYHAYQHAVIQSQIDRGVAPTVEMFYRAAAEEDGNDLKNAAYPERLPLSLLRQIKADAPEMFASQYMLNPRHASRDRFDKEDFQYYTGDELRAAQPLFRVLYCDPARSVGETSDYTAAAVIGVSANRKIYLLDGFRERLTSDEMGKKLSALHKLWKPDDSIIEKNGLEQFLRPALELHGFTEFRDESSYGKKEDRIRSLHPFFKKKAIWLSAVEQWRESPDGHRYDLVHEFQKEALGFPHGEHDDFLDALQGAVRYSGASYPEDVADIGTRRVGTIADLRDYELAHPETLGRGRNTISDPVYSDWFS
jgi:predicted phage terminase large subunit-like protein